MLTGSGGAIGGVRLPRILFRLDIGGVWIEIRLASLNYSWWRTAHAGATVSEMNDYDALKTTVSLFLAGLSAPVSLTIVIGFTKLVFWVGGFLQSFLFELIKLRLNKHSLFH